MNVVKNKDQSLAKSLVFNLGILSNKWREKASVEESDLITNWAVSISVWRTGKILAEIKKAGGHCGER